MTTNILEQQSEKKRRRIEIVTSNSLSIPQIYRLISHRTFSNDPISFAVESAKLSGLGEPGKDWPPHALNFQARRAQSVIRYRLNSPSIFLSLLLCFSLFHSFFFSFVPLIFFFSLSPSIFLFSLVFPLFFSFFLVRQRAVERPSNSVARHRTPNESRFVSLRQLLPCLEIESIESGYPRMRVN